MASGVLCKDIVERIRIKVPLSALERNREEKNAGKPSLFRGILRILIVEDSAMSFALTSAMIERITGAVPDRAHNGEEAVNRLREETFDLVFMDQFMPVMSGIEATRLIRDLLPLGQQPIIVGLSGASNPVEVNACMEAGMDHFLAKPLRLAQIEQTLALAADRAGQVLAG